MALDQALETLVEASEIESKRALLERYLWLVLEWNKRGNLISRADEERIVERHVLDSILLVERVDRIAPKSILDLGSGGGFPAIPLLILRPKLSVTLLESRRMKALFLIKALTDLGIERSRVWCQRIERIAELPAADPEADEVQAGPPRVSELDGPSTRPSFDLVTARAVSRLHQLAHWIAPVVRPGGDLLTYKGSRIDEELERWASDPGPWEKVLVERDLRPHTHLLHLRKTGS